MNYSTPEYLVKEISDSWQPIIDSFMYCVAEDILRNGMPEVTNIEFTVHYGLLRILYTGGDSRTDAYANLARTVSGKYCYDCGIVATRHAFGVPKCNDCV